MKEYLVTLSNGKENTMRISDKDIQHFLRICREVGVASKIVVYSSQIIKLRITPEEHSMMLLTLLPPLTLEINNG